MPRSLIWVSIPSAPGRSRDIECLPPIADVIRRRFDPLSSGAESPGIEARPRMDDGLLSVSIPSAPGRKSRHKNSAAGRRVVRPAFQSPQHRGGVANPKLRAVARQPIEFQSPQHRGGVAHAKTHLGTGVDAAFQSLSTGAESRDALSISDRLAPLPWRFNPLSTGAESNNSLSPLTRRLLLCGFNPLSTGAESAPRPAD